VPPAGDQENSGTAPVVAARVAAIGAARERAPRAAVADSRDDLMTNTHSFARTTVAHLLPGLLAYVVYVPASAVVTSRGLPPPLALFLTMLVVLIPFELGVLAHAWKTAGSAGRSGVVPYTRRLSAVGYAVAVPSLLAWAFFCFFVIAPREESFVKSGISSLLGWSLGSSAAPGGSRAAWIATMCLGLVVNGLAMPVVEELYFRGYLLPRIPGRRRWSPLLNALLFSLYHFFSPWQNLSRTLAVVPIAYVVSWKRSIYVGVLTHCLLNTIAMSMALASLLK
jgi:membrane protease YdiL (CAAX protease family)